MIHCENCLDTMDFMPDNYIDLTVTSPPYDNLRKYNGYCFDFENIARELFRTTKKGGVLIWVVGDKTHKGSESGTSFRQALYFKEVGFNLHDTQLYVKKNYIPLTHNRYEQAFEYMFCFTKGAPKTFNPILVESKLQGTSANFKRKGYGFKEGAFRRRDEDVTVKSTKIKNNIFTYPTGNSGVKHPAPFPLDLAKDQIVSWSNEGDLIYDPFCGSGTTGLAALTLNRNFIGSEISQEYCDLIKLRLAI